MGNKHQKKPQPTPLSVKSSSFVDEITTEVNDMALEDSTSPAFHSCPAPQSNSDTNGIHVEIPEDTANAKLLDVEANGNAIKPTLNGATVTTANSDNDRVERESNTVDTTEATHEQHEQINDKNLVFPHELRNLQKENTSNFAAELLALKKEYVFPSTLFDTPANLGTNDLNKYPTHLDLEVRRAVHLAARNVYHLHIQDDKKRAAFDFKYAELHDKYFGKGKKISNELSRLAKEHNRLLRRAEADEAIELLKQDWLKNVSSPADPDDTNATK